MSLVGKTLDGRYEVRRILGEGGMGLVYEGRHVGLGRKVAIKVLHAEFVDEEQAAGRFMQEAQIAGSLGHPNICDVTDIGVTPDDLPYMVMPLLEGMTLAQALEEAGGRLDVARSVDVVSQVLAALRIAHEAGIVHRDLKPENIFLTRVGDREDFVKVLDFGISKVVREGETSLRQLTATGMVVGTPYYMAPEQAAGQRDLDARVDVYAVGALLYELLTGRTVHEADNYNQIIVKIVNEDPSPLRRWIPDLPAPLEVVVLKALSRDRTARFEDVRAFRLALLDAVDVPGAEDALGADAPGDGGADSDKRRPGDATADGSSQDAPRQRQEPNTLSTAAAEVSQSLPTVSLHTQQEPRRRSLRLAVLLGVAVLLLGGVGLAWYVAGARRGATRKGVEAPRRGRPVRAMRSAGSTVDRRDAANPAAGDRVTIRFVGLPDKGVVRLGGQAVRGGIARVPRSSFEIPFRVEAPGFAPLVGRVTPDQDRTLPVLLAKPSRPVDGGVVRSDAAAAASMGAASPGHGGVRSRPGARPPAPRWRPWVIRGRQGTSVKTNYDED